MAFQLPATPIYDSDNAPLYFLEGSRMLVGELIYRDFFEFTFPGTQLLYRAVFGVLGARTWIPAALMVLVGVGLAWTGVAVSRSLLKGAGVFLASAAYLVFAVSHALDPTHHWFSLLAVLAALAILIKQRSIGRLFASGLLTGLATDFTQTRGPLVALAFAVFLAWEWRSFKKTPGWFWWRAAALAAGFIASVSPVILYFSAKVGWRQFLYCTWIFPLKYYSLWDYNTFRHFMTDIPDFSGVLLLAALPIWIFVYVFQPLIYALFFVRYWRNRRTQVNEPWPGLMLVALVGVAFMMTIASAPNWLKFAASSLPAFTLLTWFVHRAGRAERAMRVALYAGVALAGFAQPLITQLDRAPVLALPSGPVALPDPVRAEKFKWFSAHLRPADRLFETGDTDLYFPLGLTDPTPIGFLTPSGYTRREQVAQVIEALDRQRVRWTLWTAWLSSPSDRERADDNLAPLEAYLRQHYRIAKVFVDGDEAWERIPDPAAPPSPVSSRHPIQ